MVLVVEIYGDVMDFTFLPDAVTSFDFHSLQNTILFAQEFQQDVLGDMAKGWRSFVETRQYISLIIGFTLGYLLRSVTNG